MEKQETEPKSGLWGFLSESDPATPFFELPSVKWLLYYIPRIALAAALFQVLIAQETLRLDFSAEGVNYFVFTVMRVPLAILALLVPSVAILAANHRSVQSKETMRLTRDQNAFANYYKHISEFTDYLTDYPAPDVEVKSARRVHCFIYGERRDFTESVVGTALGELLDAATEARELYQSAMSLNVGRAMGSEGLQQKASRDFEKLVDLQIKIFLLASPMIEVVPSKAQVSARHLLDMDDNAAVEVHGNGMTQIYLVLKFFKYALEFDQFDHRIKTTFYEYQKIVM